MNPLLASFGPAEWTVIAIGCIAVIVVPAIVIAGTVTTAEWLLRLLKRRYAAIPLTATIPAVPAAASAADIDAEWADIETQLEKSK